MKTGTRIKERREKTKMRFKKRKGFVRAILEVRLQHVLLPNKKALSKMISTVFKKGTLDLEENHMHHYSTMVSLTYDTSQVKYEFDLKMSANKFYEIRHISQTIHQNELKFYNGILDIYNYILVNFICLSSNEVLEHIILGGRIY
jgi:hypothetical protein